MRLDQLLVERGLAETRSKAQALILAHQVMDGQRQLLTKAGMQLAADADLTLKEKPHPYVSRGGLKLAQAIDAFGIQPQGQCIADIGASTGGFTDVLLMAGASRVIAVDVGYGQLHEKLRQDARVENREKTNARHLTPADFAAPLDGLVCDASFISLKTVLPGPMSAVKRGGWMVALIKPQFEVGKDRIGKGGVVRDAALHTEICAEIQHWAEQEMHWQLGGVVESPITGPKGNKEFLLYATNDRQV